MSGPLFFYFVARPIFPPILCRPSSFAQNIVSLYDIGYIDRKCLQKGLFKEVYRIIKYNYRISFSSKIDLKMNKNRKSQKKSRPS